MGPGHAWLCASQVPTLPCLPRPQTGEWQLPLGPDKLEAMRGVMVANPAAMDEGLLAACYSWMRKASEDKLDGGWRSLGGWGG